MAHLKVRLKSFLNRHKKPVAFGVVCLCLLAFLLMQHNKGVHSNERHKFKSPTNSRMVNFISSTDTYQQFSSFLNPFLIERTVGSPGHTKVRNHIIDKFTALGWQVEADEFTDVAPEPYGSKTFTNVIATLNPSAKKFLTLSCHYDSKIFKDFKFVAATDSAVPCAMLVDIATTLDKSLKAKNGVFNGESIQMVFFDGEEAFENWTPTDSIYGARHLAEKWSNNGHIDKITSLILLDLIGGRPTKFANFFEDTSDLFERLRKIETKVKSANLYESNGGVSYFSNSQIRSSYIEDDHIPFLKRGVPVLHLISHPFPSVWHTERDNASNLDHAAIANVLRVLKVFLLEYFHLSQ